MFTLFALFLNLYGRIPLSFYNQLFPLLPPPLHPLNHPLLPLKTPLSPLPFKPLKSPQNPHIFFVSINS